MHPVFLNLELLLVHVVAFHRKTAREALGISLVFDRLGPQQSREVGYRTVHKGKGQSQYSDEIPSCTAAFPLVSPRGQPFRKWFIRDTFQGQKQYCPSTLRVY